MTCIVGLVRDGRVYMGGDSAAVDESHRMQVTEPKVFRHGPMIIGDAGAFRAGQVLRYCLKAGELNGWGHGDPLAWLVEVFIPPLRQVLEDHGVEKDQRCDMLVGLRGRLFQIDEEFQVLESAESFAAIGSGRDYALGALCALGDWHDPEFNVKRALEVSEQWCSSVKGPWTFEVLE